MIIEFLNDHDGWKKGEVKDIEITLARRLIGLGKARFFTGEKPAAVEAATSPKAEKRETATGRPSAKDKEPHK